MHRAEKNFDCILNELLLLIFGFEKYIRTPNMQSENSVNIFTQIPRHDGGQYVWITCSCVYGIYHLSVLPSVLKMEPQSKLTVLQ